MRRIFLVGCPRSGTTLVQSLLAAAPGMVTFTESHFFDRCFPSTVNPFGRHEFRRAVAQESIERFCRENKLPDGRLDDGAWASASTLAAAFVDLLDRHASAQSAEGWIEKTPDHLRRISLISAAAPDALFVHVLRRPAETIASLCKASADWGKPRGWPAFAAKWALTVTASSRYAGKSGHIHVFYDDVIGDTRNEGRRLYHELGLAWDDGVLQRYRDVARTAVAPYETWKSNNAREIGAQSAKDPAAMRVPGPLLRSLDALYRRVKSDVNGQQRR